ncbi:hypothetical protein [Nitrobacter winogradskyi]|uniref:Uncharacterized protein n=3 Tax=Nitrobacter winogradskyi TaxID=913 RepID=A0ACC6AIQ5_NITWI|nr:hypothetical protein [Nitrobacter winogradskyi]MCP1999166.1 hypothetical protein [Nitrobacter winogradskyi]GEC14641.1 hypothetical protein NWI01_05330 [Nitrobacter winogradskyi]
MEIILGIVAVAVGSYLIINGKRNADPLNRKCAAEICEYLADSPERDPTKIFGIFMSNARYQKQALHVISMVPVLLIKAGHPKEQAMGEVPFIRAVAMSLPK